MIADAIDEAVATAEFLDAELCWEAMAAAELCACCAAQIPERLPDNVRAEANPHWPHANEVELATRAVRRVREESAVSP